ncbi:MAG: WG repeat-containing protein, partial [Flavobacteriaceae bacterium]
IWDFQDGSTLTITEGQNNKFGFIDGRGNWVIEPIFKEVLPFSEGLAPAYLKRKWGFINENGEFVIEERFNGAGTFSKNGLAPIRTGYWGFTNKEGEIVIDPRYFITTHEPVKALPYIKIAMETNGFVNGWALVFKVDNGFVFINDKGEVLGDKRFEYAAPFTEVD